MMVPALLRKFEPHIRDFYLREYGPERGRALAAIPHEATGGRLMLRTPGYHLDPHLDPKRVVFTCLLYFARPATAKRSAPAFYRMNGTPKIDRTSTFYPGSQGIACDLVKDGAVQAELRGRVPQLGRRRTAPSIPSTRRARRNGTPTSFT